MNEYLKILQIVNQNSEEILSNQTLSSEINHSAKNLKATTRPCLRELQESLLRLQELLQPCFQELEQAEDVWNSKPNIGSIPQAEIVEEIGLITGQKLRLPSLTQTYQTEILTEFQQKWTETITELKNKYFQWDPEKEKFKKNGLNMFEKDSLIKDLQAEIEKQGEFIKSYISLDLKLIVQELNKIESPTLQKCLTALDRKSGIEVREQIEVIKTIISEKIEQLTLPASSEQTYQEIISNPVIQLKQKSNLGLSMENFNEATLAVEKIGETIIKAIFDERLSLINQWLEQAIAFYNNFLEKQTRYQEETQEIRQIEKSWLNEQKEQLITMKQNIDDLLCSENLTFID